MTKEMELLLKGVIKYDLGIGVILSLILFIVLGKDVASIYLLGIIIAVINFWVSGNALDKHLSRGSFNNRFLFPLIYIIRILCITLIAVFLAKELTYLLSYLGGYISHFPILTFYWIKNQKGSD